MTRIRRLYDKDQEVIWQGSGGYMTRVRRLYDKDQEVIIFFAIFQSLPGLGRLGKSGVRQ